jgi:hypothetical protein
VVDLIFGSGRQSHQQRIEVVKDGAVFLVHRTMRFVDDDQIEVASAKAALAVVHLLDHVHHCRIRGHVQAPSGLFLRAQVHRRRTRQMLLEGPDRLVHQRHAVGQEEHSLGPVGAHQQVAEGDHRARLACAGGHHQQGLALLLLRKVFADALDGPLLVVALHDLLVDLHLHHEADDVARRAELPVLPGRGDLA